MRVRWTLPLLVLLGCDPSPAEDVGLAREPSAGQTLDAPTLPRVDAVSRFPVSAPTIVVSVSETGLSVADQTPVGWDDAATLIGSLYDRERERTAAEATPFEPRLALVVDAAVDMSKVSTLAMIASNVGFHEATLAVETESTRTRIALALARHCDAVPLERSLADDTDACETKAMFTTERGTFEHRVAGRPTYCTPEIAKLVHGPQAARVATISTPEGRCVAPESHDMQRCPYVFAGAASGITWGQYAPELAKLSAGPERRAIVLTSQAVGALGCDLGASDVESLLLSHRQPADDDAESLDDLRLRPRRGEASVELGATEIDGEVGADILRRIVRIRAREVGLCYRGASKAGEVAIAFTIAADGHVSTAKPAGSTLGDKQVDKCIAKRIDAWKFPKPSDGKAASVRQLFRLAPS